MRNPHEQSAGTSINSKSNPTTTNTDLLPPKEAAVLLSVHPITLRRYRHDGKLKAFRLPGGRVRYQRSALLALLEEAIA